jgi:hypothetical protein
MIQWLISPPGIIATILIRIFSNSIQASFHRFKRKDHYKGGVLEYDRLHQAQSIDYEAALASASWGTFQIMGFNYQLCGYTTVLKFVDSCYIGEREHLKSFAGFIKSARLLQHLKNLDWASFAKGYNGPSYKQNNYDTKLEAAYRKYLVL